MALPVPVPVAPVPLPALLDDQVQHREPHPPVEGLDQEHVLAGLPVGLVTLRDLLVRVPDQDRVHAGHLPGHQRRGVLRERQGVAVRRGGVGARVRRDDDQVTAPALELRHEDLRLLDQPGELHPTLDVGPVPDRDAGVGQAQDAHLQLAAAADAELLDHVRREDRSLGRRVHRVGTQQREVELRLEGAQGVDPVVELVVAQGCCVVADQVHRRGHRVDRAGGDRVDLGVVVGQRRALDGVAGIEGEDRLPGPLRAHRLDQRAHLGQPDVVVGLVVELLVLEVVPVDDVAVQVGRAEHAEADSSRLPVAMALAGVRRRGDVAGGGEGRSPGEYGATRGRGQGGVGRISGGHQTSREVDVGGSRVCRGQFYPAPSRVGQGGCGSGPGPDPPRNP